MFIADSQTNAFRPLRIYNRFAVAIGHLLLEVMEMIVKEKRWMEDGC